MATTESREDIFNRWLTPDLADPDPWIGVFENQDPSHPDEGRRIAYHFAANQWNIAVIGDSSAPDHKNIGPGWRYILVTKVRTVGEAVEAMRED